MASFLSSGPVLALTSHGIWVVMLSGLNFLICKIRGWHRWFLRYFGSNILWNVPISKEVCSYPEINDGENIKLQSFFLSLFQKTFLVTVEGPLNWKHISLTGIGENTSLFKQPWMFEILGKFFIPILALITERPKNMASDSRPLWAHSNLPVEPAAGPQARTCKCMVSQQVLRGLRAMSASSWT